MITVGTAAEIKEAWNLQDALNVFGCRIRFEDEIIIASWPSILVPKLVNALQLRHDLNVPDSLAISEVGPNIQSISGIEFLIFDRGQLIPIIIRNLSLEISQHRLVHPTLICLRNHAVVFRLDVRLLVHVLDGNQDVFPVDGPVPVRQGHSRIDVLHLLLEIVQVQPMPGQELFPSMLAVIGMNVRPISETSFIVLMIRIVTSHYSDDMTKSIQLIWGQTFDILSGFCPPGLKAKLID